jgi:hypothetical protein
MSDTSTSRSISTLLKSNRKGKTCMRMIYFVQITALAKFCDCRNAIEAMMVTCPMKSEFKAINQVTNNVGKQLLGMLYNANKQILAIMTLDMDLSHGLAMIQQTERMNFCKERLIKILRHLS